MFNTDQKKIYTQSAVPIKVKKCPKEAIETYEKKNYYKKKIYTLIKMEKFGTFLSKHQLTITFCETCESYRLLIDLRGPSNFFTDKG